MTYGKFEAGVEKPKQEATCIGPLQVRRDVTDFPYIVAFGVMLLVWLSVGIYAFCVGDSVFFHHFRHYTIHMEFVYMAAFFHEHINQASHIVIGFVAWSAFLLAAMAVLFRYTTKIFVWVTVGLSAIMLLTIWVFLIYGMEVHGFHVLDGLLLLFFITIVYALLVYSIVQAGTKMVCKIIRESCKVMFFFPSTLALAAVQFSLQLLIAIFSGAVYMYLTSIRQFVLTEATDIANATDEDFTSEELNETDTSAHWFYEDEIFYRNFSTPAHVPMFHLINYCGFFWSTWFLMGAGRMVLTAAFATWYQTKDKSAIPLNLIPQCFMMIMRHHAGTLAYASSPITIVPMCIVAWKYGRDKLKEMYKRPVLMISWLTVALKFSFDAMTMTAINGHTFYKSAKESYILFMKHPVSYLAMNTVTEYVIVLGTILQPILSMFSVLGYISIFDLSDYKRGVAPTAVLVVSMIAMFMSITFFMVFRSAANTIRHCYQEDAKANHESEMNLYQVQVDDLSIDDVEQDP
ncbi:CTL-like protein 2 isoform X2 [Nasonia vitripennis]|uniref:Choline transporter-like protein n=1 Tax=Nasonia vitripennis TaxID=7425 RepID=A0A7M7G3L4_NASVI|nr:CTL-like protein 2 isoform X2 [Nasonia vitripennis]